MNRKYLITTLGVIMGITAAVSILFGILSVMGDEDKTYIDIDDVELVQCQEIEDGAPIAIISTSMGEIRAVLYPEYAPKTVENFVKLANEGFYDGTYIYSVSKSRQFVAGAENRDGTGSDENDKGFDSEIHANLWPFKGAFLSLTYQGTLCEDGTTASGNRFVVCSSVTIDSETRESLLGAEGETLIADAFEQMGGIPAYSQTATVFAQTYEGFDVLDAILSAPASEDKPKEDIIIESIEISEYSSDDAKGAENAES